MDVQRPLRAHMGRAWLPTHGLWKWKVPKGLNITVVPSPEWFHSLMALLGDMTQLEGIGQ